MRYLLAFALLLSQPVLAQTVISDPLQPTLVTEWKAVYGRVEARDRIPARARIGGTLVHLAASEGDEVVAGQELASVVDEKIVFQLRAIDAQLQALTAQLDNAQTELTRGEELLSRGVTTSQRLDALRTQVDIVTNQIASTQANRHVVEQQAEEGKILAPMAGKVLTVSVTEGSVILPGEAIATLGGGGFFLRLAVPERHAGFLTEGAKISIETASGSSEGQLAKIYPLIENGRVIADVETSPWNGLSFLGIMTK
jgi:multidrug efflux pump subunit AcrA (membrane-fusion protein)